MPTWLLPESVSDCLPSEARQIESLRRELLDLFEVYGYELVQPPLMEYADALVEGGGADLDLRMFKLVDQLTGRTLGIRADMTPQVARIDAHRLGRRGIARLSYCGSVLHTRPSSATASREVVQVGAEIYGHAGLEADIEALTLMLEALSKSGMQRVQVVIGHLGLLRAVLALDPQLKEDSIFPLLVSRDIPGLSNQLRDSPAKAALLGIAQLGQVDLKSLRRLLPQVGEVEQALVQCEKLLAAAALKRFPKAVFSFDFADAQGYRYHSGITFSAYRAGESESVGRGGRYDDIGARFGRARSATGFSLNLRALAQYRAQQSDFNRVPRTAILAPWDDSASLVHAVSELRSNGEIVIQQFPGAPEETEEFSCDRELRPVDTVWQVRQR